MSQVRAGAAYVELLMRKKRFDAGIKAARRQLDEFSGRMRSVGLRLSAMSAVMAAPIVKSVAVYSSFDDALKQVRAISQASASEFATLEAKVLELGRTTSFTASQVADLMTELARAGFRPGEVINMTEAVMDLARATGTDASRSAGIMAASIRQFGLDATEAGRVSDALTTAANKSFNTVESLGESLKYAAPLARGFGMSLEETLAILGSLGNMGVQGSEAGTSIRRLLTLSAAASKKFYDEFGVETKDARGSVRPLIDILGDVADVTKDLGSAERGAKFASVFGLLGITAATSLGQSVTNTKELYEALENAGGVASRTAKEMDSGIGGAFRLVLSAAEGMALSVGKALDAPIQRISRSMAAAMAGLVEWIDKNNQAIRNVAKVILGIGAAGAALLAVGGAAAALSVSLGAVSAIAGVVAGAFAIIKGLLVAMLTPIGLAVVGIAGLGSYLLWTSGLGGDALADLTGRFGVFKGAALASIGAVGRAMASGDMGKAAEIAWLSVRTAWLAGTQSLREVWEGFKVAYMEITSSAVYGSLGAFNSVWAAMESAWVQGIDFFADGWSAFAGFMTESWHRTVGFIQKAWVRLKSMFDSDINVDAEVNRINQETTAKAGSSWQSRLGDISDRDSARRSRLSQIEQYRRQQAEMLAEMEAEDRRIREQAGAQAIASTAADLADARKRWEEAVATPDVDAEPDAEPADKQKTAAQKAMELALQSAASMAGGTGRGGDTAATFSAAAIRGMGASSLADRQLRATEEVATNTAKLVDLTDDGGLSFT